MVISQSIEAEGDEGSAYEESDEQVTEDESDEEVEFPGKRPHLLINTYILFFKEFGSRRKAKSAVKSKNAEVPPLLSKVNNTIHVSYTCCGCD